MMPCPTRDQFVRFVDSSLSLEETRRVEAHVAMCPRCREQDRALRTALGDIKAATVQDFDVQAHIRAVMERVDSSWSVTGRRRRKTERGRGPSDGSSRQVRWPLAESSSWLTWDCAFRGRRKPGRPRGGPVQAHDWTRCRRAALYGPGKPSSLGAGATFDDTTPLTAGFRNLGYPGLPSAFRGRRAGRHPLDSPRFTRSEDNPASTTLPPSLGERVLDTTVVLEDVSPGPLRIVAASRRPPRMCPTSSRSRAPSSVRLAWPAGFPGRSARDDGRGAPRRRSRTMNGRRLLGSLLAALAALAALLTPIPSRADAPARHEAFAVVIGNNRSLGHRRPDSHYADDDAAGHLRLPERSPRRMSRCWPTSTTTPRGFSPKRMRGPGPHACRAAARRTRAGGARSGRRQRRQ